jgi:hypothetical protein
MTRLPYRNARPHILILEGYRRSPCALCGSTRSKSTVRPFRVHAPCYDPPLKVVATMAAMTSTMQMTRCAAQRSVAQRRTAAPTAMFGSKLAVRPASVQV